MIEMTLDLADRATRAALSKAAGMGIAMTVSVVDEVGRLVVTMKGDGTGFLTAETSRAKAIAAVAFGRSTRELVELQKVNPVFFAAVPAISRGEPRSGQFAVAEVTMNRVASRYFPSTVCSVVYEKRWDVLRRC